MIKFQNMNCIFESGEGLKDINTEVNKGDIIAVIGPSGSGKSLLLRCINLLQRPTGGQILINGQNILDSETDIYEIRKHIGMVFQAFTLFSHKTLLENVMMGQIDLLSKDKNEAFEQAKKYLQMVGLGEKLHFYPDELSGGQKQRGEIARCLAMNPDILLLDEPTSALDSSMAGEVQAVINRLAQAGLTMMIVTHDFQFCRNIATRVFYMDGGQIYEQGTPEEVFDHPKKERTAAFVQNLRSLKYDIESKDFDLYELNARMESFGRDYFLSKNSIRNLELVIEELVIHNLLNYTSQIHLDIQYYEATQSLAIRLVYSGNPFNPFDNDEEDILSMLMVRQFSSDIEYRYLKNNILKFQIRI